MKEKFIKLYMDWAKRVSELSYARRLKLGAVVVKDDCVISYGYNGMPAGWDNNCEDEMLESTTEETGKATIVTTRKVLKTKPEVIHAEINAIAKVASSNDSTKGSTIFITHAPCADCAKMIIASGIETVNYINSYRDETGIDMLKNAKIFVIKLGE